MNQINPSSKHPLITTPPPLHGLGKERDFVAPTASVEHRLADGLDILALAGCVGCPLTALTNFQNQQEKNRCCRSGHLLTEQKKCQT
jgi:hypothetical protein